VEALAKVSFVPCCCCCCCCARTSAQKVVFPNEERTIQYMEFGLSNPDQDSLRCGAIPFSTDVSKEIVYSSCAYGHEFLHLVPTAKLIETLIVKFSYRQVLFKLVIDNKLFFINCLPSA